MPASPPQASPPHDTADAPAQRPAPANLRDLFWSFTWLALQGFGGVLAVVQRELVGMDLPGIIANARQWRERIRHIRA